jgi:hypothetical protein
MKFDGKNIKVSRSASSWSCTLARGTESSSKASLNYDYGELRLQERLALVIVMQHWIAASNNTTVPSHSGCLHFPLLLRKCYTLPILFTALL